MNNEEQKPHREAVCPSKTGKLDLVPGSAPTSKRRTGRNSGAAWKNSPARTEFREMMHREFPKGASEWLDAVSRRGFLKLMGASTGAGRYDRLHQAAAGADRAVC